MGHNPNLVSPSLGLERGRNTWMQNTMDGRNYIRKLGHFAAGRRSPTLAFSFASLADIF